MRSARLALLVACGCGRLGFGDSSGAPIDELGYPETVEAVLGTTALTVAPRDPAPAGARFSLAPTLPAGLTFDPATGVIAGTPQAAVDDLAYAITAAHDGHLTTATLRLTVLPGYVVDVDLDAADDDAGVDATCRASAVGGCTLRAAIETANHRGTKQLVLLDARPYRLGQALPALTSDVVIAGQGAAVTSVRGTTPHPGFGFLVLATRHTVGVRKLTVAELGPVDGPVAHVTQGALAIEAAQLADNVAASSGGALFIAGGASVAIDTTLFVGNSASSGNGWGGVIDGEDAGTSIVVRRSTATRNVADWGAFAHITEGTTLRLENSTLYGNKSAIAGTLATPGGLYTLIHATIAANTTTGNLSAGLYLHSSPGGYTLASTLVAGNTDAAGKRRNCHRVDVASRVSSRGGNLFDDDAGTCAAALTGAGDQLGRDPALVGGLADHGGPTPTVMPAAGSLAIDHGAPADCLATDQRGQVRPLGAGCDVGAVEAQ